MNKKIFIKLIIILILSFCCCLTLFAEDYGKIKGHITDKATGEPILGASVMLIGTRLGATTGATGSYIIYLVKPGIYKLRTSTVEYKSIEVPGIEVFEDSVKEVNIVLEKPSLSDLEKVIRTSPLIDIMDNSSLIGGRKSPIIVPPDSSVDQLLKQYDTTVSSDSLISPCDTVITKDKIGQMPVRNVDSLLRQTAGDNVTSEGEILIRGGRIGEVRYITGGEDISGGWVGVGPMSHELEPVSGNISGKIIDKKTGDPIVGAIVSFENMEIFTKTDLGGNYYFWQIKKGKYKIAITAAGYRTIKNKSIKIKAGKTSEYNFKMKPVD